MKKCMLEFYETDGKLKLSVLEELKTKKYIKLYKSTERELFAGINDCKGPNDWNLKKVRSANYQTHYCINYAIKRYMDELYNETIASNGKDSFDEKKAMLMEFIKIDTNRILELKKQMKYLGNSSVSSNYINSIFKTYDLKKEDLKCIVSSNVYSELRLKSYEEGFNWTSQCNYFVEKMLETYEIPEEIKNEIINTYKLKTLAQDNPSEKSKDNGNKNHFTKIATLVKYKDNNKPGS